MCAKCSTSVPALEVEESNRMFGTRDRWSFWRESKQFNVVLVNVFPVVAKMLQELKTQRECGLEGGWLKSIENLMHATTGRLPVLHNH